MLVIVILAGVGTTVIDVCLADGAGVPKSTSARERVNTILVCFVWMCVCVEGE